MARVAVVAVDDDGAVRVSCRGRLDGFTMLTGVREAGGTLWFGSLHGSALATMPRPGGVEEQASGHGFLRVGCGWRVFPWHAGIRRGTMGRARSATRTTLGKGR